jgi:hypothetical protein
MSRPALPLAGHRAPGVVAVVAVVAAATLAGAITGPVSHAQPAPAPAAELSRAKDLYRSAEAAMTDGRFDDAARDYGAAYEASKDPALLFKIGRANENAGKCDAALRYYARYLHDGNPSEPFVTATRERITACGGDGHTLEGSAAPVEPQPGADRAAGTGSAATVGSAAPGTTGGEAATGPGSAAGSAAAPTGSVTATPTNRHTVAWIITGGAIALATLGSVLAYAASSSENDVRDLYVGFAGQPAAFDARTMQSYDDLVSQGQRYQHLSWASFGLAGAAAAGAAVLFVIGGRDEAAPPARIAPIVTPTSAGVTVTF